MLNFFVFMAICFNSCFAVSFLGAGTINNRIVRESASEVLEYKNLRIWGYILECFGDRSLESINDRNLVDLITKVHKESGLKYRDWICVLESSYKKKNSSYGVVLSVSREMLYLFNIKDILYLGDSAFSSVDKGSMITTSLSMAGIKHGVFWVYSSKNNELEKRLKASLQIVFWDIYIKSLNTKELYENNIKKTLTLDVFVARPLSWYFSLEYFHEIKKLKISTFNIIIGGYCKLEVSTLANGQGVISMNNLNTKIIDKSVVDSVNFIKISCGFLYYI